MLTIRNIAQLSALVSACPAAEGKPGVRFVSLPLSYTNISHSTQQ